MARSASLQSRLNKSWFIVIMRSYIKYNNGWPVSDDDDDIYSQSLSRSTVFIRWRQYAGPSSTRFLGPTPLTDPKGISIRSSIFPIMSFFLSYFWKKQYSLWTRMWHESSKELNSEWYNARKNNHWNLNVAVWTLIGLITKILIKFMDFTW